MCCDNMQSVLKHCVATFFIHHLVRPDWCPSQQPVPPHRLCMDEHSKKRQHCVYSKHTGKIYAEENSSTKNYNILELMSL